MKPCLVFSERFGFVFVDQEGNEVRNLTDRQIHSFIVLGSAGLVDYEYDPIRA